MTPQTRCANKPPFILKMAVFETLIATTRVVVPDAKKLPFKHIFWPRMCTGLYLIAPPPRNDYYLMAF